MTRKNAFPSGRTRSVGPEVMLKQREAIMIRLNRIMIEEMEGVAGISRPRRRLFPGGGSKARPFSCLPVEYAPLRRKVQRAVRFPQLHRPLFRSVGSVR